MIQILILRSKWADFTPLGAEGLSWVREEKEWREREGEREGGREGGREE